MREQGWNPYKEEEEMIQSAQAGSDRYDAGYRKEEDMRKEENPWWERENRRGDNLRREREVPLDHDSEREKEIWRDHDRMRRDGSWSGDDRMRRDDSWSGDDRMRRDGSWSGDDRRKDGGSWPENKREREWNTCGENRGQCGKREIRNMDIPDLSSQEKESLAQNCWKSVDWGTSGSRNGQPYRTCDHMSILKEEQSMEKELRRLQSMYPQAARDVLPMVEDACDQMEYEGSMMFDEVPDQSAVRRISDRIYEKVREMYPDETGQPEPKDEVLTMQYQGRRRRPPHGDFLQDLVQVMLLQEMHRRRCRHRRCRRF